jgi:hypothetical protein
VRLTPSRAAAALLVGAVLATGAVSTAPVSAAAAGRLRADASPNGPAVTLSFGMGGATGVVSFMGLSGQAVSIATSGGTFSAACDVELRVSTPDGTGVAGPVCAGTSAAVGPLALGADGTYKVKLVAGASATGTLRVAVTSTGPIASITPNAKKLRIAITAPLQVAQLGFLARAGDRYSAVATNGDVVPRCRIEIAIVDARGKKLRAPKCVGAPSSGFVDVVTIPSDGIYYLRASEHDGSSIPASFRAQVFRVVDVTRPITADGTPDQLTIRTPGQRGLYQFAGTTGQRVSVLLPDYHIGDGCYIDLVRPDGTQLASTSCFVVNPSFLDTTALDATGTWTVVIDPDAQAAWVGTTTVQVFTVTDIDRPITVGQPETASFTIPGQNAFFRFSGTSGDQRTIVVTNISMPDGLFDVVVVKPDGFILDGVEHGFIGANFNVTLDETGTFTILVNPGWAQTGDLSVALDATAAKSHARHAR